MHFTSLSRLCFSKAQFFSVCEKFYEIDSRAKSRFWEINLSSKAGSIIPYLFFHSRIIRLKFSWVYGKIITSKTNVLDGLVWRFSKNYYFTGL